MITYADDELPQSQSLLPYLYFLKQALEKHQNMQVGVKQSSDSNNKDWFWVDIPVNQQKVRIGFQRDRIGAQPPQALMIVLMTGLILTLITAVVLTRRLTVPVERLYQAAHDIGKGHWPKPIKEEGPEELKALARTFNRMNIQVKDLLENRTTLLSGIAHDLRTPLTQIQLALEMLPNDGGDIELMESIKFDLKNINHLIGASLSIGLDLAEERKEEIDLTLELNNIISHYHENKITLIPLASNDCVIQIERLALHRIIINLLENAIRYGNKKPIIINYLCEKNHLIIKIKDRGTGIPQELLREVFQPFYRLEQSRNSNTGGSGLGLAIVRQLADSHNWDVTLVKRENGGTTAEISIPR